MLLGMVTLYNLMRVGGSRSMGSMTMIKGLNLCVVSPIPCRQFTITPMRGTRSEQADKEPLIQRRSRRMRYVGQPKGVTHADVNGIEDVVQQLFFPSNPQPYSGLPDTSQCFTVLGIETSCDDTAAAVVRSDGAVLGEVVQSQHDIHEKWGGIVPNLAFAMHEERIGYVIEKALSGAGLESPGHVDAVAVTVGPGLEICLRVGCEAAKKIALQYSLPFVAVHHLEAHILLARSPLVLGPGEAPLGFPFLALLVSGGHCQLILCKGAGSYAVLGGTLDDAMGEAYDKVARMLGLSLEKGGGAAVEAAAARGRNASPHLNMALDLPVPMQKRKDMNFSFAGLKNAFRMAVDREKGRLEEKEGKLDDVAVDRLANAFQACAITHVEERLERAMVLCEKLGIRSLVVVGGVAANSELRQRIGKRCKDRPLSWRLLIPPPSLCTDNGVMVAWSGIEKLKQGLSHVALGQQVYARAPLTAWDGGKEFYHSALTV
eukprot:280847_1